MLWEGGGRGAHYPEHKHGANIFGKEKGEALIKTPNQQHVLNRPQRFVCVPQTSTSLDKRDDIPKPSTQKCRE